jgi:hypothetical protein
MNELIEHSNMTSFFGFVDKRAIYRWYNFIRTCAVNVTDFSIDVNHTRSFSIGRAWCESNYHTITTSMGPLIKYLPKEVMRYRK